MLLNKRQHLFRKKDYPQKYLIIWYFTNLSEVSDIWFQVPPPNHIKSEIYLLHTCGVP